MCFVYGTKYQTFIPQYIFFANKAYPGVEAVFYVSNKLTKRVRKNLELLRANGFLFSIHAINISKELGVRRGQIPNKVLRAARWLICDDYLKSFDEIYHGDVDLLVCPERTSLFEQHEKHMAFLGLPYSNIVRPNAPLPTFDSFFEKLKQIIKNGLEQYRDFSKRGAIYNTPRISGLMMMRTKPYFEKLSKQLNFFKDVLKRCKTWGKDSLPFNLCTFDDERFGYFVVEKCFDRVPTQATTNGEMVEDPLSYNYRPHHGLHLGIFRTNYKKIGDSTKLFCTSPIYLKYYAHYLSFKSDPLYEALCDNFDAWHKKNLKNMETFYSSIPNAI